MPETRKLNLRLPQDLYAEAAATAEALGISLNAFLVLATRNWTQYQRRNLAPPAAAASTTGTRTPTRAGTLPVVGRNDPCPCGSGLKFKRCHGKG